MESSAAQMIVSTIDDTFSNFSTLLRVERDILSENYEVHYNGWNAHPSVEPYIHDHWKAYPSANPLLHYIYGFINIIFFIVSLIGNGVIIWVFVGSKSLRTPSNMFIVLLALADFFMMLKTPIVIVNSFYLGPVTSMFWCKLYGTLGSVCASMVPMANVLIAFDRYRTIARPFDGKIGFGKALGLITLCFCIAIPIAALPALEIWNRYVPEGYLTTCGGDYYQPNIHSQSYLIVMWILFYMIPSFLILYFYGQIFTKVKAHEATMREQAKKMNVTSLRSVGTKAEQETSAEIRIAKVGMCTFFLHILAWTPYVVIAFLAITRQLDKITPFSSMVPSLFCKTVGCFDPFMYAVNHPKYRIELMKKIPWFCVHEEEIKDNPSQSQDNTEDDTEDAIEKA